MRTATTAMLLTSTTRARGFSEFAGNFRERVLLGMLRAKPKLRAYSVRPCVSAVASVYTFACLCGKAAGRVYAPVNNCSFVIFSPPLREPTQRHSTESRTPYYAGSSTHHVVDGNTLPMPLCRGEKRNSRK